MNLLPVIAPTQKPEICGPCGGSCCKSCPGIFAPGDLSETREGMVGALVSLLVDGRCSIDYWEGDFYVGHDVEYCEPRWIRPAIKGRENLLEHAGWGGECTFLTPAGCELDEKDRPHQCRSLEPIAGGNCEQHHDKESAVESWIPWQDEIGEALDEMRRAQKDRNRQ